MPLRPDKGGSFTPSDPFLFDDPLSKQEQMILETPQKRSLTKRASGEFIGTLGLTKPNAQSGPHGMKACAITDILAFA
jgi:hypothetical protein